VIYAELNTQDLATYVNFLKSDAGRHLNDLGQQAFTEAMAEAAAEAGRAMPATIRDDANP